METTTTWQPMTREQAEAVTVGDLLIDKWGRRTIIHRIHRYAGGEPGFHTAPADGEEPFHTGILSWEFYRLPAAGEAPTAIKPAPGGWGIPAVTPESIEQSWAIRDGYLARRKPIVARLLAAPADTRATFVAHIRALGGDIDPDEDDDMDWAVSAAVMVANRDTTPGDDPTFYARAHEALRQVEDWLLGRVA
jgi:hypothetical protein